MTKINKTDSYYTSPLKSFNPSQTASELKSFVQELSVQSKHYPISIAEIDKCSLEAVKKIIFVQLIALAVGYQDPETVQKSHTAYLSQVSDHCKHNKTSLGEMKSPREIAAITKHFNKAEHWVTIERDGTERREIKPTVKNTKAMQQWQDELDILLALALESSLIIGTKQLPISKQSSALAKKIQTSNLFPIPITLGKRKITPNKEVDVNNLLSKSSYTKQEMKQMLKAEEAKAKREAEKEQESIKADSVKYKKRKTEATDENQQLRNKK